MRLETRRSIMLLALLTLAASARAEVLENSSIPNFRRVNARILRGGQPADAAWRRLAGMGVGTVLDLRRPGEHSTTAESLAVIGAGMRYLNVPMDGLGAPSSSQITRAMSALDGTDTVFVHCAHGKDRTGTLVALYRIRHEGWSNVKALDEAESCGIHWYEGGMKRLIRGYPASPPAVADTTAMASDKTSTSTASPVAETH
jgi:protein tyrosine phosphatase (PTP) superfamily phosphohydrolase (DUF442 family)